MQLRWHRTQAGLTYCDFLVLFGAPLEALAQTNEDIWFRDLDSNQDSQLQRLMCYRLHYPGTVLDSLAEPMATAKCAPHCGEHARNNLILILLLTTHVAVRPRVVSAKLVGLCSAPERWPSGLRRTLGKRV